MNRRRIETINGHRLPELLLHVVEDERVMSSIAPKDYERVFTREAVIQPTFYSLSQMQAENAGWPDEVDDSYLGKATTEQPKGRIDPKQSVLIGDLGPDRLIALDYRWSLDDPSVVYLTGDLEPYWVEAAKDVESLLIKLRCKSLTDLRRRR